MWEVINTTYKTLKFLIKDEKDQINPKLILSYKNWEERVNKELGKGWYEAKFVEIRPYSYETKDKKVIKWFSVILDDEQDWEVRFNCSWSWPSRRFVNYLCWRCVDTINKIKISTSSSEWNGKTNATLWLNIDWQTSDLLVGKEEMKNYVTEIINPDTKEVMAYSYKKLEDLLESKYNEVNLKSWDLLSKLQSWWLEQEVTPEVKKVSNDDLPFN